MPNDILFESGRTDVKADGKAALAKVALALAPVADRAFLVAGHTDSVPIRTELFPSNRELSTRRAVEVVHVLVAQGMNPKLLAAAGYGEFDPVHQTTRRSIAHRTDVSRSCCSRTCRICRHSMTWSPGDRVSRSISC